MDVKAAKARRLFVKAGAKDAMLNWYGVPELQLDLVADEYFNAAKALSSRYEQMGHNDLAAYPIVSTYRHSLELFLKSLLHLGQRFSARPLDSDATKALKGHRLVPLWEGLDRLLGDLGMRGWFGLNDPELPEIIREFDSVDPQAQSFRYTSKKDGTAACERDFRFSVRGLSEAIDPKLELLSGACTGLREHYNNLASAGWPTLTERSL
jgi:hypothetical protein